MGKNIWLYLDDLTQKNISKPPNGLRFWRWGGRREASERKKVEAQKILEMCAESPASSARFVGWLYERKTR